MEKFLKLKSYISKVTITTNKEIYKKYPQVIFVVSYMYSKRTIE